MSVPENRPDQGARRRHNGQFRPGASGNPGGRPKLIADIRDLAREHTQAAVNTLVHIAENGKQESARVAAATALLDRGWGRPTQPIAGDNEMAPIGFEDRQRLAEEKKARALALIYETFGEAAHELDDTGTH